VEDDAMKRVNDDPAETAREWLAQSGLLYESEIRCTPSWIDRLTDLLRAQRAAGAREMRERAAKAAADWMLAEHESREPDEIIRALPDEPEVEAWS
jgi:hypothetical protein